MILTSMGPKEVRSTVLSTEEEAVIVAFRKHTLLPLDSCFYALKESIRHLTRASLHRCLQRHRISRLPDKIYIVLTDNGIQFADSPKNRNGATALLRGRPFDRVCKRHGIEHRLTKPNRRVPARGPDTSVASGFCEAKVLTWTNGQVERMYRAIKAATVNRYYYQTNEQLEERLNAFLMAYNFAKRLKTLKGLSPLILSLKLWLNPQMCSLLSRTGSSWDYPRCGCHQNVYACFYFTSQ